MLARLPHASRLCRAMAGGAGGAKRPRASKAAPGGGAAAPASAPASTGLWLLKSEPDEHYEKGVKARTRAAIRGGYLRVSSLGVLMRPLETKQVSCSADDLAALAPAGLAWEGVRNYGARNALRQMAVGDRCLLQHTGKAAAVVATLRVVRAPYAEEAQFDANGPCVPVLIACPVQPRSEARRVRATREGSGSVVTPLPRISRISHTRAADLARAVGTMTRLRRVMRRAGAPWTSLLRRSCERRCHSRRCALRPRLATPPSRAWSCSPARGCRCSA